ncbi:hypothetical protein [Parasphingopyxis lamellibrachiae]|uniref:Uncharacterized protein n=1 Tax=Parasphingopyxis lamellibrachiae TaxID=680125 RepID=A0A3D9FCS1_9SPHN|nr:hypothetical protein [Parasphingopyxis lamellibrachiae]RED15604.1 hypothetical protein DFR46_0602 [Parasphingopyxis lamellibrachiae]
MFQLLAALFFTLALIAPLAVIVLTLHQNWAAIAAALRGTPSPAPIIVTGTRRPRAAARISSRPVRAVLPPVRAAA